MEEREQQRQELLTESDEHALTIEEQRIMLDELQQKLDEEVKSFHTFGMLHFTSGRTEYNLFGCNTILGMSASDIRSFLLCEKRR